MKFEFTPDQSIAKDTIKDFILGSPKTFEDYFITLSGYAGTGKTTIMNSIIKEIKNRKKIVVSAPTHTAKEVIGEITNQNAETIQALLGLRPNVELEGFNPNKPVFEVKAEERIQFYDVVIIDEASMLNSAAVALIEEKAIQHKVKVIYMGDKYQLPPVGETISKVFKLKNVVNLETIVRQSNSNPNLKLIELARNDVRDGTDLCIPYLRNIVQDMNGEEGFKLLNKDNYYQSLLELYYDSEYAENPKLVKTLCWTNNAVTSINRYLRSNIIKSDELVAVGDILTGYKTITKEIPAPPFYLSIVRNSVDYIVKKVERIDRTIMGCTLSFYAVTVKDSATTMYILHRDSYADFIKEIADRAERGNLFRQWKQYYDFKNEILLMETIQYGPNIRDKCDKDIDYGYAITVHKSQGSTYTNVGVTLTDILKNRTPPERRKLIYVALSRTSKLNLAYA
jgi:hypothetical protein